MRVEGNLLVVQQAESALAEELTTLARAAEFAGTVANSDQAEHDTIELGDLDRQLDTRAEVGLFLGDWFGLIAGLLVAAGAARTEVEQPQGVFPLLFMIILFGIDSF